MPIRCKARWESRVLGRLPLYAWVRASDEWSRRLRKYLNFLKVRTEATRDVRLHTYPQERVGRASRPLFGVPSQLGDRFEIWALRFADLWPA